MRSPDFQDSTTMLLMISLIIPALVVPAVAGEPAPTCTIDNFVPWQLPGGGFWLEGSGKALLLSPDARQAALAEFPGCTSSRIDVQDLSSIYQTLLVVGKDGRYVWGCAKSTWCVADPARAVGRVEAGKNWLRSRGPMLSSDGASLGWIEIDPAKGTAFEYGRGQVGYPLLTTRDLVTGKQRSFSLPGLRVSTDAGGEALEVVYLDAGARKAIVFANFGTTKPGHFLELTLADAVGMRELDLDGIPAFPQTFIAVGKGWVAWDGTPIRPKPSIAWDLPSGRGRKTFSTMIPQQFPKIDNAAVSADLAYVAVGVGHHTRTKLKRGFVAAIRVRDGRVVYQREMHDSNGGTVAFAAPDFFMHSMYDEKRGHHTQVVRLPP